MDHRGAVARGKARQKGPVARVRRRQGHEVPVGLEHQLVGTSGAHGEVHLRDTRPVLLGRHERRDGCGPAVRTVGEDVEEGDADPVGNEVRTVLGLIGRAQVVDPPDVEREQG